MCRRFKSVLRYQQNQTLSSSSPCLCMSRVLQKILFCSQRFSFTTGYSTQHAPLVPHYRCRDVMSVSLLLRVAKHRVLLNRAVLDIISQFENCPDDCTSRDGKRMRHYIQIDSKLSA